MTLLCNFYYWTAIVALILILILMLLLTPVQSSSQEAPLYRLTTLGGLAMSDNDTHDDGDELLRKANGNNNDLVTNYGDEHDKNNYTTTIAPADNDDGFAFPTITTTTNNENEVFAEAIDNSFGANSSHLTINDSSRQVDFLEANMTSPLAADTYQNSHLDEVPTSAVHTAMVENISRAFIAQLLMQNGGQIDDDVTSLLSTSTLSSFISYANLTNAGDTVASARHRAPKGHMADRALEAIQQALATPKNDGGFFFDSPKGVWVLADVIISLLAILANVMFIDAIRNIKLDLKGYRHFLVNLSITDIFTAIICLANFTHQAISNHTQSLLIQKCGTNFLRSLNIAGLLSNLLSLFGMSIDHYIGVFHPLRYQQIMGNARIVNFAIILIWLVSLLSGVIDGLVLLGLYFVGHDWSASGPRRGGLLANNYQGGSATSAATISLLTLSSTPALDLSPAATLASSIPVDPTPSAAIATVGTTAAITTTGARIIGEDNVTTSAQLLTERILSLMPLLQQDLSALDTTQATIEDFATTIIVNELANTAAPPLTLPPYNSDMDVSSTMQSLVASVSSSGDYGMMPSDDVVSFDPVEEIMNFVLPNDSSILEEFIKKIIKKDSEPHVLGWCSYHAAEKLWFELFVIGLTVVIFSILIPIYCRILRQVMLTRGAHEWNARKLIFTTLLLLGAFLLCRVPFVLFEVLMVVLMRIGYMRTNGSHIRMMEINNAFNSLLMFFPLLDPIIYAIRMKAVQRYLLWRYGKCCPSVLWYCCGHDSIPDSQSVKRFSTFTYAISRGSISGNSGYNGPGPTSSASQRLLGSFSFDSTNSRRPLLDRLLPHQLSRFLVHNNSNSRSQSSTSRSFGRNLRLISSLENKCRRTFSGNKNRRSSQDCKKDVAITDEARQRFYNAGDVNNQQSEMLPLAQVHVEDEISDVMTVMVEEPQVCDESATVANNNNSDSPKLAEDELLFSPIATNQEIVEQQQFVFYDDDSKHRNSTDFFVVKLNKYLTKATKAAATVRQQQQSDHESNNSSMKEGSDCCVSSSSQLNYDDNTSITPITPPVTTPADCGSVAIIEKNDSFYERLLFKIHRLKQMPPAGDASPFFGLFSATAANNNSENKNSNDVIIITDSTAYQPDLSLCEIECVDCPDYNEGNNNNNYGFFPPMPLLATPSPRLFTKNDDCNNNSHHRIYMSHHGTGINSAKTLSNSLILNKLALHTKKLFDLETKTLNISSLIPSPVQTPQC